MPTRKPANPYVGGARAALGQGLLMGWGDEAEAWLRSRLPGSGSYEQEKAKIDQEYAQYAAEHPVLAPTLEFTGGAAPVVASMLMPGAQAAAPATAARAAGALSKLRAVAASPIARSVMTGAATGAVSGAGAAQAGDRMSGAGTGALIGTLVGGGAPVLIRGGGAGARWLRERLAPSESDITSRAASKVNEALERAGLTPEQAANVVAADRARNIPSTLANVSRPTVGLAETVAQRAGKSPEIIEDVLGNQRINARDRVIRKIKDEIPGDNYFQENQRVLEKLRADAKPAYDAAYAVGEVDDPVIMEMLQLPQFKNAWTTAREIADADAAVAKVDALLSGRPVNPNEYKLRDIYEIKRDPHTGDPIDVSVSGTVPDVRTLDYMKRALDAQINAGYKSTNAATITNANAYRQLRNALRDRTKELVPEYKEALQLYKGDSEILDALETGYKGFQKMKHEEVAEVMKNFSAPESDAFRTGAIRGIYDTIANTSRNINAAKQIIGNKELREKLEPLFETPGGFNLFKAALERESQLFEQSNKILGNSATGRRLAEREAFEKEPGVGRFIGDAIAGGFSGSLINAAARFARSANTTNEVAEKVAKLLMSSEPSEVAAAVKLLESEAASAVPKAAATARKELGLTTGTNAAFQPAPIDENAPISEGENVEVGVQNITPKNVPGPQMTSEDVDLSDPDLK